MPRSEPPITHAWSEWDDENRVLEYRYNGRPLVSMKIPGDSRIQHRLKSDAQIQSSPAVQQIYVAVDSAPVATRVTFTMSGDAVVMRPRRAGSEQAVLGQVGRPAMHGVNGIYDVLDDLLVAWHGAPWRWVDDALRVNQDGSISGAIEVKLSLKPWIIVVKPQYYRKHLGYKYHKPWESRPNTKPAAGWCSWEAYHRDVSEEKVLAAARFMAKHFKDYGLEYVQIDDGFQRRPVTLAPGKTLADAWTIPNANFPSGFEDFCRTIKGLGLLPGVWISADIEVIEPGEGVRDCRLKDRDGVPLKPFWMRVAIDCQPDVLEHHVLPLYDAVRRCGFRYVKTDQIRHLLYDALGEMLRLGLLSNDEVEERFRNYMVTARRGLGPDVYYLASWGVLSEAAGTVDACRIAIDASPRWSSVRMQIIESARWYHTQRILFTNDPDHICARTKPEWAQSLVSLVSLSGGLFMLSDPVENYDPLRVRIIQRCLPPLPAVTGETGPLDVHYPAFAWTKQHGAAFQGNVEMAWDEVTDEDACLLAGEYETMDDDHPLASLWAFHLATKSGRWCVAGRFATIPLRGSMVLLTNLGLDPGRTYVAFDFWAERFLGTVNGAIKVPPLQKGSCQIIAFRERLDHPQFLASTRHVSMDAVSVKAQAWREGELAVQLEGVPGTIETYWFHCPPGWKFDGAQADGAKVSVKASSGETVALAVEFHSAGVALRTGWNKVHPTGA